MPTIDGFVTVGFNTTPAANNDVRMALTGTIKDGDPETPFERAGTRTFVCTGKPAADVTKAVADMMAKIARHSGSLDALSISLVQRQ